MMPPGEPAPRAQGSWPVTSFHLLVQLYFVLVLLSGPLSASVVTQDVLAFSREIEAGRQESPGV